VTWATVVQCHILADRLRITNASYRSKYSAPSFRLAFPLFCLWPCRKDLREGITSKMNFHSFPDPTNPINSREGLDPFPTVLDLKVDAQVIPNHSLENATSFKNSAQTNLRVGRLGMNACPVLSCHTIRLTRWWTETAQTRVGCTLGMRRLFDRFDSFTIVKRAIHST
jgi:hypothetical protein